MTEVEKKLLVYVLNRAADEFSNHGCNDLNLVKEVGLTPEESLEFQKLLGQWSGDKQFQISKNHYTMDWMVMQFFADTIK